MDRLDFSGKTAVVSGAYGGVGRAVVRKLLEQGASVCATDLKQVVEAGWTLQHDRLISVGADIVNSAEVDAVFAAAEDKLGPIDLVVSNAGYIVSKSVHNTSEEEWDRVIDVNAKSLFLMARRALPSMMLRKSGAIVATGSISSVVGLPEQGAYCAAKGALLQLVRQMAIDYASHGIRVNAVGAGSINTPFLTRYLDGMDDPSAAEAAIKNAHPMGRWAEADEIADAICYLGGPHSTFVTGQMLMADGGYSAR